MENRFFSFPSHRYWLFPQELEESTNKNGFLNAPKAILCTHRSVHAVLGVLHCPRTGHCGSEVRCRHGPGAATLARDANSQQSPPCSRTAEPSTTAQSWSTEVFWRAPSAGDASGPLQCLWPNEEWSFQELHETPAPSYKNGLAALHLEPIQAAAPSPASHLARRAQCLRAQ